MIIPTISFSYKTLFFVICLQFIFTSCRNEKIIKDEEKFASLYVDILIVQEKYSSDVDSLKLKTDSLYSVYNVNHEMYKQTIEFYQKKPEKWKDFFEKANDYFKKLNKTKAET